MKWLAYRFWVLFFLFIGLDGTLLASEVPVETRDASGLVYVIPVHGMIEPALLYVMRRGVDEAIRKDADAIILSMNTPGGTLDAASEILALIQSSPIPVITFVEKDAYSAGAIIALGTKEIYMAPGSVIGDAMPIMMGPMGGVQAMPEDIQEKMVSGVAAKIRAAAEQGGHDKELAEAMVRREIEYTIGDEVICPEGELLTLTNIEADAPRADNGKPLLSAGTRQDIDAILQSKGWGNDKVVVMEVTSAERIARLIAKFSPFLLMGGLLGIYLEIKTPGFGLPGLLGGLCIILFFWGHHIAGLSGMEDLLIFMAGITLLIIEIFVTPGFGFIGAGGIVLVGWAVINAMIINIPGAPWYSMDLSELPSAIVRFSLTLIVCIFSGWMIGRHLVHSRSLNNLALAAVMPSSQGYTAHADNLDLLNARGVTLTALRPSGKAMINNRRVDVIAPGDYIAENKTVQVIEVQNKQCIVEEV